MKTTGLKKNLALSTIYQVLSLLLPLITAPYASRVLGVDGIGIYSYTHSWVMYFSIFAALGTVSYGSREIARNRDNRETRSQLFWEIAILTFLTSIVCLLAWGVWILFNKEYTIYYVILTLALFGTMFDISWLYAGLEQFKYTVSLNLLFKVLGAVCIFTFVKNQTDLWIYVMILSLTQTLANISLWIYVPKFVNKVSLRSIRLKKHFHETLVYFIPTIAISVYTILDKTLIGLITKDTSENGNYEQATKIINIAKTVSFVGINMVLQSRISYLFSEKKYDKIRKHIDISLDYVFFISTGLVFGIAAIAEKFVPVYYGDGYEKTIELLKYMSPLVLIVGISNCLGSQFYNPAGLRAKSAKFIVCGSLINLCLNIILIPILKSEGAVIATVIAEIIISALYMKNCDNYYSFSRMFQQIWKKILAGIIMFAGVLYLGTRIQNGIVSIVAQIGAGVIIYCIILFVLKDSFVFQVFIPQTNKMLKKIFKKDHTV